MQPWIFILLVYLVLLSLIAFCLMGVDKHRAKRHLWRIPEKTLFFVSLLGGAIGGTAGMFFFHHKTKHWYFRYGFPLIAIVQITGVAFLVK